MAPSERRCDGAAFTAPIDGCTGTISRVPHDDFMVQYCFYGSDGGAGFPDGIHGSGVKQPSSLALIYVAQFKTPG